MDNFGHQRSVLVNLRIKSTCAFIAFLPTEKWRLRSAQRDGGGSATLRGCAGALRCCRTALLQPRWTSQSTELFEVNGNTQTETSELPRVQLQSFCIHQLWTRVCTKVAEVLRFLHLHRGEALRHHLSPGWFVFVLWSGRRLSTVRTKAGPRKFIGFVFLTQKNL